MSKESLRDFIVSLGLFSTTIILTFFPILGIEESEDDGGNSAFSVVVTVINGLALLLIVYYEIINWGKACRGSLSWYFVLPLFIVLCYFFNTIFYLDMGRASYNIFFFFLPNSIPGIYIANYIYRHRKMEVLVKNQEIFFLLGSLGLIISVPTMYSSLDYDVRLAAGGGHQTISYCSALFCTYFVINQLLPQKIRYEFFDKKWCNIIEIVLVPCLIVICFMGGGRGGALLLIVNFLFIVWIFSRHNFYNILLYSLAIGLLLYMLIMSLDGDDTMVSLSKGLDRAFSYFSGNGIDMSETSERDVVYSYYYNMVWNRPVLGYGFFYCYDICNKAIGMPYPHNLFLEVFLQGGLIYFFLFSIILIKVLKFSYLYIKNVNVYFLPLLTYPMVLLMFSGSYMKMCLFWFLVIYTLNKSQKV